MSKDIDKLFASMAKTYGETGIYKLNDIPDYKVISTGSLSLDFALGIGGIPMGRVTEICGANGAGKTLLMLHFADNVLREYPDKVVAIIDMEHRLEKNWAANFIHDMDRVLVLKPGSIEEGINMFRDLAESGQMAMVAWDSIGGSPTAAAMEKDAHKQQFAGNSKAVTALAQHASTLAGKHGFAFVGINQIREDMSGYRQLITPGGVGWKHACTLRIQLKRAPKGADGERIERINGEDIPVGYKIFAKVVKSSVSAPGRVGSYWFYNVANEYAGFGIDKNEEVVRLSTLTGVVERRGGWHYHEVFPDGKLLGQTKVKEFLDANLQARDLLFKLTMASMQSGTVDLSSEIPMSDPEESLEPSVVETPGRPQTSLKDIAAEAARLRNAG